MCCWLGVITNSQNKYSKLKMRNTTAEISAIGAWGLHLSSFIMASMPYLQAASLILAIVVSILTLRKLVRDEKKRRKG